VSSTLDDAPSRLGSLVIGPMGLVLLQLVVSSQKAREQMVVMDPHLHLNFSLSVLEGLKHKRKKKKKLRKC